MFVLSSKSFSSSSDDDDNDDNDSNKNKTYEIVQKEITYTPGLYKIFDEILVNAADNKQRDPNMDKLDD